MEALGRIIDLGTGIAPYDTNAGAGTGKRVNLQDAGGITIVVYKGAGSGTDDPVLTFQQHTLSSGGTTSNLATIDHYYGKTEAALDNDEAWVKTTQAASQTVTLTGSAQLQGIFVFEIEADDLADGYAWVSVNIADTGSAGAQLGAVLYILRDLHVQRKPTNLGNLLSPGSANA